MTANGAGVDNHGEKKVRFWGDGTKGRNSIVSRRARGQAFAAASKIMGKGNSVLLCQVQVGPTLSTTSLETASLYRRSGPLCWRSSSVRN